MCKQDVLKAIDNCEKQINRLQQLIEKEPQSQWNEARERLIENLYESTVVWKEMYIEGKG